MDVGKFIGSVLNGGNPVAAPLDAAKGIVDGAKSIFGMFKVDKTVQAQIEQAIREENVDLEKASMANELAIAQGQLAINLQEAKNNRLIDDWRDAVGWTCAFALFWNYVGQPFGVDIVLIVHGKFDTSLIPKVDLTQLFSLLGTMLATGISQYHAQNKN